MKKRIIILKSVIVSLCLTAFSLTSCSNSKTVQNETLDKKDVAINSSPKEVSIKNTFPDFIYDIGPRFNPIKKVDLNAIRSFEDVIDKEQAQRIVDYNWVTVILIKDDKESHIREFGTTDILTEAQLKLLHSFDYSTNLKISADVEQKNKETGQLEDSHWSPYFTIIPEKQAEYSEGKEALKEYLKNYSLEARTKAKVEAEKLKAAKLYFTVTKSGIIENVRLDRSSNYPLVDETMIELIKKTSGTWKPAENFEGKKVDQELVVSFGLMGC